MAQTEGQITSKHVILEVSTDGIDWSADLSGDATVVTPSGGESMTGSTHTFEGHYPLVGIGKHNPVSLDITYPYTEVDNETADLIDGFFVNETMCWVRYRPAGTGGWTFTGQGYFVTPITPTTDATTADIIANTVTWFGAKLERGAATT
ncbi:hypothetical protein KKH23_07475 [Patescibacteria group bacterium]|nr:hypothetical protein [Patescibacteria group bacterium]